MMKVLSVVGTRPNFIKMAPIVREIRKRGIEHVLVHTGQHYDKEMSKIFLKELEMPKLDYFLDVGSGSHGMQTGKMLIKLEKVMMKEMPDYVMIPGDTNTSLAGALASTKIIDVSVCHVESGLRSYDMIMPEEKNRIMIDHIADFLFCPTVTAVANLKKEGISQDRIFLVGDTMVQACHQHVALAKKTGHSEKYRAFKDYFLVTVHRAENTDSKKRITGIIKALLALDETIMFPVHPRTKKQLIELGLWDAINDTDKIRVMEPIGYLEFLFLLSNAKLMITDSGGVQKEAFLLKVPCVTLRDNTEWVETIDLKANILVGADKKKILAGIRSMLAAQIDFNSKPFGDDIAAKRIVDVIMRGQN